MRGVNNFMLKQKLSLIISRRLTTTCLSNLIYFRYFFVVIVMPSMPRADLGRLFAGATLIANLQGSCTDMLPAEIKFKPISEEPKGTKGRAQRPESKTSFDGSESPQPD